VQFACLRSTFCKSECNHRQEQVGEDLSGNQPDQLSGFIGLHLTARPIERAPVKSNTPSSLRAATPSADFNYSRPDIAINRRPVTSRALPQALHNASCVFTERSNKSAYHLQPSINCGDTPPHTEGSVTNTNTHQGFVKITGLVQVQGFPSNATPFQ
jgi:hypothetical protein